MNFMLLTNLMRELTSHGFDLNANAPIFSSEFECIGQEVEEYLCISCFITVYILEERFNFGVYNKLGINVLTFRHVLDIADGVVDGLSQIEKSIKQLKLIFLELCKV